MNLKIVTPEEGEVEAGKSLDCILTYKPSHTGTMLGSQAAQQGAGSMLAKNEEEKLVMKV